MKRFALLILLAGCDALPKQEPCSHWTDHEIAQMAGRMQTHVTLGLDWHDARLWCRSMTSGEGDAACCDWMVEEFYGEME